MSSSSPAPTETPTARIKLTRGYETLVDQDMLPELTKYKWHVSRPDPGHIYAATTFNGKDLKMHRLIMGAGPGELVDHINGDGLDNRRENLRVCTAAQNSRNSRAQTRPRSSEYKGVTLRPSGKWRAQISVNGRKVVLGDFGGELVAAMFYDAAAERLHGSFAWTNLG